jgi:hypothetical protein
MNGKCEQEIDSTTRESCDAVCGSLGCVSNVGYSYGAEFPDDCEGFSLSGLFCYVSRCPVLT